MKTNVHVCEQVSDTVIAEPQLQRRHGPYAVAAHWETYWQSSDCGNVAKCRFDLHRLTLCPSSNQHSKWICDDHGSIQAVEFDGDIGLTCFMQTVQRRFYTILNVEGHHKLLMKAKHRQLPYCAWLWPRQAEPLNCSRMPHQTYTKAICKLRDIDQSKAAIRCSMTSRRGQKRLECWPQTTSEPSYAIYWTLRLRQIKLTDRY